MSALVQDLTVSSLLVVIVVVLALIIFYRWRRSVAGAVPAAVGRGGAAPSRWRACRRSASPSSTRTPRSWGRSSSATAINFGIIQLARYVEERRARPHRRGRAGDRPVGHAQGDAVGGARGRGRLRVAGRHAVPRLPAVRRHRRARHAAVVGRDVRAGAVRSSPGSTGAGCTPRSCRRWSARRHAHGGAGAPGHRATRATFAVAAALRDGAGRVEDPPLRPRPARVRLLAPAAPRHLDRRARATGARRWTRCSAAT